MIFFEAVINKIHPENEANCIHSFERSLGIKILEDGSVQLRVRNLYAAFIF